MKELVRYLLTTILTALVGSIIHRVVCALIHPLTKEEAWGSTPGFPLLQNRASALISLSLTNSQAGQATLPAPDSCLRDTSSQGRKRALEDPNTLFSLRRLSLAFGLRIDYDAVWTGR